MRHLQIQNRRMLLSKIIKGAINTTQSYYALLKTNQKLYVNATIFLLIYLLFPKVINPDLDKAILSIFIAIWVSAMCCDLLHIYKKVYESLIGKSILLILFTVLTSVALSFSAQVVNEATGVNPTNFPHTQRILAILSIPLLAALIGGIVYIGTLVLSPLILMFQMADDDFKRFFIPGYSSENEISFPKITRIIQIVSFAVLSGLIYGLSQKISNDYNTFLTNSARTLIYNLEMYTRAPCPIEKGARFAFIVDDQILVGTKNKADTIFYLAECKPKL